MVEQSIGQVGTVAKKTCVLSRVMALPQATLISAVRLMVTLFVRPTPMR